VGAIQKNETPNHILVNKPDYEEEEEKYD